MILGLKLYIKDFFDSFNTVGIILKFCLHLLGCFRATTSIINILNQNFMKKILLLIAFTLLTTSMYAEKIVATYTMSNTKRNVEAGIDDNGALNVFIQVVGENSDYVMIRLTGESDIRQFISKLTYCKNKFVEWEQVAKQNKVFEYKKYMDVTFPDVEVWWVGLEWYSSYKKNFIKPIFLVNSGQAGFGTNGRATHWANEFIDQGFYILFESASEIQSLINALNIPKIKNELNKDIQTDALFR